MKFQKKLSSTEQTFQNPLLSETCMPYKQWKKAIKYHQTPTLNDLDRYCKTVERVFHKEYQRLYKPKPVSRIGFRCCLDRPAVVPSAHTEATAKELLAYAEINAQAVYKMCKKLEKNAPTTEAMKYLTHIRTNHAYDFLGSDHLTRLRLETMEDPKESEAWSCPICFEDLAPAVLFPCGHYQCFQCLCRMTDYAKIPATFSNRLTLISRHLECPFCRFHLKGDRMLRPTSFWPQPPPDAYQGYLKPRGKGI